MVAVAQGADVASGTVLYHYPDSESLADAVADRLIEETHWPEVPQIPVDASLEERVDVLLETVYAMYEAARFASVIYNKSRQHPAVSKLQNVWDDQLGQTIIDALGSHVSNADKPMISAILEGPFLSTLVRYGIQEDRLRDTASRLIIAWLESGD